jgi:hypothetical protein
MLPWAVYVCRNTLYNTEVEWNIDGISSYDDYPKHFVYILVFLIESFGNFSSQDSLKRNGTDVT